MYAAERSTLVGSLPLKAPPPWRPRPPQLRVVLHEPVGQVNRQGHEGSGLVTREAEHHPLVARAARVHADRDVRRLGVDQVLHLAGVRREARFWVGVADLADGLAG